ncbi:MAG: glycosyltransferase family 4 protein [Pseudanabaena sp. ELA607]
MKVLHINQLDVIGGAAIAALRLHEGLSLAGCTSHLLVGEASVQNDAIIEIKRHRLLRKINYRLSQKLGISSITITNTFDIAKHPLYQAADVINFHNLHGGYFNYLALPFLTKSKPAVLTVHDMWNFTGHCASSHDCDRWQIGCGKCPYPQIYPPIGLDNTKLEWRLKNWVYHHADLQFIYPSRWVMARAKSSMLKDLPMHHIPHGIDTTKYQPLDKAKCRYLLDIPLDKKVIMFAAEDVSNPHKGGAFLCEALANLPDALKAELLLVALGKGGDVIAAKAGIPVVNLGYISHDRIKAAAFSAADLFVFPTLAEIFGLVLQESMACGTPIVAFDVGGVGDLVRHNVTGYLAKLKDTNDLCNGIIELLSDDHKRNKLALNCRHIVCEEYSLKLQAERYIKVYQSIIG